jgi:hypothetical protein
MQATVPWYPTRLLDLGSENSEQTDSIHPVHTKELALNKAYITLSHRRARGAFLRLTWESLQSFYHAIPATDLPRSFREAVIASRILAARYLWTDSLCIVQDKSDLSD